jgi:hypothetical protein
MALLGLDEQGYRLTKVSLAASATAVAISGTSKNSTPPPPKQNCVFAVVSAFVNHLLSPSYVNQPQI